jgi:DNA-binding HxlR family transcriptional regulator
MPSSKVLDPNCSIARSLGVLGERWTFLILREAIDGVGPTSVGRPGRNSAGLEYVHSASKLR